MPQGDPSATGFLGAVAAPDEALIRAALSVDGVLAQARPGFKAREGQQALAEAIGAAIRDQSMLVAEAGTGTGKTYAYLVPALLAGGRVVISTGTRNLQDQLYERDLPQVRDALGVQAQIALLKGRSNYICRFHLRRHLSEGRFTRRQDIVDLRRIDTFSRISDSGDRSGLAGIAEDAPAWTMATSTRDNCLGQECGDYENCFVYRARQRAQQADIVVVNHHLFCADLALRDEGVAELLPTACAVIFDEAHQLPEVATNFFGEAVSTRQVLELGRDALACGLAEARDHADWAELNAGVEQHVREWRLHAGTPSRLDVAHLRERPELLEAVREMTASLGALAVVLKDAAPRGKELARCALRATELEYRLRQWLRGVLAEKPEAPAAEVPAQGGQHGVGQGIGQADTEEVSQAATAAPREPPDRTAPAGVWSAGGLVLWADVGTGSCTLHATPLSVAEAFRRHREQRGRAWIFLSATLAIGGQLDFYAQAMGLEAARQMVVPSPFDFPTQALLYVPTGVGNPSGADFAERLLASVWPLIEANGARTFILCTTLRMVDRLGRLLEERIRGGGHGFELLCQGQGTRAELLERFRRHAAPILVGSASFWEGVDVPGEQLSLVIIDKLPFAPPDDPVLQARGEAVRREGGDPFRRLHLPATAMVLKQGAGRLIRSESDRGVLVVGDVRLAERPYGRAMLRSLPPFRRTRALPEVLDFISARTATSADPPLPDLTAADGSQES